MSANTLHSFTSKVRETSNRTEKVIKAVSAPAILIAYYRLDYSDESPYK